MVSTAGGIAIAVVVLLAVAAVGWIVFTYLRARRLGLPPPTFSSYLPWKKSDSPYGPPRPAPGGVVGWFNAQLRKFQDRGNRSASGAYEGSYQGTRRGFGPLDPDEAWDTRVDHEGGSYGYYEQELESRGDGADRYNMNLATDARDDEEMQRGRKPSRDIGPPPGARNPFDDDAADSLRGVSPRPMDSGPARPGVERSSLEQNERRSVFREEV
ncbi:hypothetical protein S40285_05850 [Stachybotrys chlorohalonatus IBT 40285]|uniref:Acid phosphatase-like protein n=1 Tax=Stachybotrys chlorohalonatus (strain IBT 40285) TaxID=1283841 RepID=A0A084QET4_STAC4|nr:hypothetical protein S40285_05850 [Stachybotrys chlorohalonata IBT 40285]